MNTETLDIKNKIRVVLKTRITMKHPFTIPITKLRENTFLTGQKLTYKKMIGEVELTESEAKEYPVVINPTDFYKVNHMQPLDRTNDYDKAIIKLLELSGRVALSLTEYNKNPVEFVGYLEDKVSEADSFNKDEDERFEAESAVRDASIDDYEKIALIVNYRMGKNIDVKNMPASYIKSQLIKAAHESPSDIKKCFPKYNPGVAEDIYILQLIRHNILTKKPSGDIFDNGEFISNGIEGVIIFMRNESKSGYVNKWKTLLDQKLGLVSTKIAEEVLKNVSTEERSSGFTNTLDKLKAAILDENIQGADYHYNILATTYSDMFALDIETSMQEKMNTLRLKKIEQKKDSEINAYKQELDLLDLEKIQKKIIHQKTPFKKEDCQEFWEDKTKIIDYMSTVKFSE